MRNGLTFLFFWCAIFWGAAQKDSIFIKAQISEDRKILSVSQKIIYQNRSGKSLEQIKLLHWAAAYQQRNTALVNRKLEDRNSSLHFARETETGKLLNLSLDNSTFSERALELSQENIFIPLKNPLASGDVLQTEIQYTIQLPDRRFTGYGTSESILHLKYFFLVPDHFDTENKEVREFLDTEESVNFNTFWKVQWNIPAGFFIYSNLHSETQNAFSGNADTDPEFVLSAQKFPTITITDPAVATKITFGYAISPAELQNLEFFLPLQLRFIKERTGKIPEEIFISEKFKSKEDFFGNNDINFWKFRFKLFTDAEKTDQDYFGIIAKKILDQQIITEKENHHWFKNGLKTYLEIQYLKKFYGEAKLLGNLTETKLLGIKPVKFFHISEAQLLERYGLAYQYIMAQNLDQKIAEPYSALSNFNDMAISNFQTGTLFAYSADKLGEAKFNELLKNYIEENKHQQSNPNDFLEKLAAHDDSAQYLSTYFSQKNRTNFKIKKAKNQQTVAIKIFKNTAENILVKVETVSKTGARESFWVETPKSKQDTIVPIPNAENIRKIVLNNHYIFPESYFGDNYLYTTGLFANTKHIKFKLIKDLPNPEFHEIYLNPRIRFTNTYDKFLIGMNFKNQSLFDQKFLYSITPSYSTGTGKITGSGAVSYSFLPAESVIRNLTFGVSGSYFHYDFDLSYRKASLYSNLGFRKDPRSTVSRGISASYNYFERELSPEMIARNDYDKYNLWTLGYGFSDNKMIHEKSFSISTQGTEDFNKITSEAFYRWEFAPKQKLSIRFFAGYFLRNETRNNTFDYGISRVSDYSFSYNLLGQSATGGILSQQFVLADGGFKSLIPGTVNHWITSFNVDTSVWKIFHVYADAALYRNKNIDTQFIWDSGVKVRVIPDFLEIYLPVQSSLGFEPAFKDYGKRIRYTLILNLSTIINAARRGWF